ncbi:MAG TPA: biopolymer transporter ExbD [Pirellulaceae bacterium]|jgi:biopolymer transport protein ExbD
MSIEFLCQVCGRELKADERAIGRKVRCPDCATLLVIPDPAAFEEEQLADEPAAEPEPETPPQPTTRASHPTQRSRPHQPEEDLGETAPMELGDVESLSPPSMPSPTSPAPKKRRRDKQRRPPAEVEPQPESIVSPTAPPATSPSFATNAASPPPPAPRSTHDDAPLLPKHPPHPEDLIDMTAMVDIVFFLLIFFLVTSLQSLEAVMNLPTPQSGEPGIATGKSVAELENDPNFITVRIEDDDSIWVENTQVFNDQELSLRLRTARQESDGPRSLLVVADADASHGTAVRVFDAGAGAGVSGISLVVQEKGEGGK